MSAPPKPGPPDKVGWPATAAMPCHTCGTPLGRHIAAHTFTVTPPPGWPPTGTRP